METPFNCPVCFEIPEREIYQCTNGHIICSKCIYGITLCPECRVSYGATKIRARVLETILENQHFDCIYKESGCIKKCKREEILSHAKSCGFNPENFSFCQLIGYDSCRFDTDSIPREEIISHFKNAHSATMEHGNIFKINHENFKAVRAENLYRFWSPTILSFGYTSPSPLFLIMGNIHSQVGVSWNCIQIWDTENSIKNYEVKYTLQQSSPTNSNSKTEYPTAVTQTIEEWTHERAKYAVKANTITFPLSFILENFLFPGGSVVLNIEIRKRGADRVTYRDLCVETWAFIQPITEDEEISPLSVKLQQLQIQQKQNLSKQKKQKEQLLQTIELLNLQHSALERCILESQLQMGKEHKLQKSEREESMRQNQKLVQAEIQEMKTEMEDKEKLMLHRHMQERQKLNQEKIEMLKKAELKTIRCENNETALLKHIITKQICEKQKLEDSNAATRKHMADEMKILNDQLLQMNEMEKALMEKQNQIDTQVVLLEEQMLVEYRLKKEMIEKQNQIDDQKIKLEKEMEAKKKEILVKQTSQKQLLEMQIWRKRRAMKSQMSKLEAQLSSPDAHVKLSPK